MPVTKLSLILFVSILPMLIQCNDDDSAFVGNTGAKELPISSSDIFPDDTNFSNDQGNGFLPPTGSITQGSFTVWTEPEDPEPEEFYSVHIQAQYPDNISNVSKDDLTGCLEGTDGFIHVFTDTIEDPGLGSDSLFGSDDLFSTTLDDRFGGLNCDSPVSSFSQSLLFEMQRSESFSTNNNTSTKVIDIPGAGALVRDTIEVFSKVLGEQQTITIEF